MLEGLDEINWSQLHHAYGEASDVPGYLRALLSPNIKERERALWDLANTINHQGTIYEVTPYVIPFLYELIEASETPNKEEIVSLLLLMGRPIHEEEFTDDAIRKSVEKRNLEYKQYLMRARQVKPIDESSQKEFENYFLKYGEWLLQLKSNIEATIREVGKKLPELYSYADIVDFKWIFAEALPAYPEYSSNTIPMLEKMLINETDEKLIELINRAIKTLRNNRKSC